MKLAFALNLFLLGFAQTVKGCENNPNYSYEFDGVTTCAAIAADESLRATQCAILETHEYCPESCGVCGALPFIGYETEAPTGTKT